MLPVDLYVAKSRLLTVSDAMRCEVCAEYVAKSCEFSVGCSLRLVTYRYMNGKGVVLCAVWVVSCGQYCMTESVVC